MSTRPDHPSLRSQPAVELAFDPMTLAPSVARQALRPVLEPIDPVLAADVELVVSELVTNVVRHTGRGGVLRAFRTDGAVRVEVDDAEGALPVVTTPPPDSVGGRGLLMVDRIADVWGVDPQPSGKRVWAVLRPPGMTLRDDS